MDKKKYPYLYEMSDCGPDDKWEDCVNKGWQEYFKKICDCINEILQEDGLHPGVFHIDQLKEKFGFLRCYWHIDDDCANEVVRARVESNLASLIDEMESTTAKMCSECGAPAEYHSTGWVLPYCSKCAHEIHDRKCERYGPAEFDQCWCKA